MQNSGQHNQYPAEKMGGYIKRDPTETENEDDEWK
jgi:hypothetical protein